MPTRPAVALILLGWMVAATGLFRRDILPDFLTTPPPDLRSIAVAGEAARPTKWNLSVADDATLKSLRPVGQASTRTEIKPDGTTNLISQVSFESNEMLRQTPFASNEKSGRGEGHLTIANNCEIDPTGHLRQFRIVIRSQDDLAPLMTIDAHVVGKMLEIVPHGPIPFLNQKRSFPYESRGLIQNGIGPIDRLPGLQVGQRWKTEVVSPITGMVESVVTEVTTKRSIDWNSDLVETLEVVQKMTPISARTWVRRDGLVLRQEIPLPMVRLILDRVPDPVTDPPPAGNPAR